MKREHRKALAKQARRERSRREHNATLMSNAIALAKRMDAERAHRIQLEERHAARQAAPTLFEGVMDYMRSMGVGPIVINVPDEPKPATIAEPEAIDFARHEALGRMVIGGQPIEPETKP
jgi:hypothetical protein